MHWHMHYLTVCNLKTVQLNIQRHLIWQLILYMFKLCHKNATVEATKIICCAKSEGVIEYSAVTRWLKIFLIRLQGQGFQAKEANLACSTGAWHLIIQYGLSPSQSRQKYLRDLYRQLLRSPELNSVIFQVVHMKEKKFKDLYNFVPPKRLIFLVCLLY